MQRLLACAVVLVALAGSAIAADLGIERPNKPETDYPENVPYPFAQGGDTHLSAVEITSLPFSSSGSTTGFNNDYDEVCPFVGSNSPDVVYSYMPAADIVVDIDLCGSSYDTKLYVYDEGLGLVACNDDFYISSGDPCGTYVSKLVGVPMTGGSQFYIVVDGYSGAFGDYVIEVTEFLPCIVACPPVAATEQEPPLMDGYDDDYNGGCNSSPPVHQVVTSGEFCGKTGYYLGPAGQQYRDTDWFTLTFSEQGVIEITGDAEEPTSLIELVHYFQDCPPTVGQSTVIGPCLSETMTLNGAPGSTVWVFVAPVDFWSGETYEYSYVLTTTGATGQVEVEECSILPDQGGICGEVTVVFRTNINDINGIELEDGLGSTLVPTNIAVDEDGYAGSATFDLTGASPGLYDVVLVKPSSDRVYSNASFTVDTNCLDAEIWVNIHGSPVAAVNQINWYSFYYGNSGNNDAHGSQLWIKGIPLDAEVIFDPVTPLLTADADPELARVWIETEDEYMCPLILPTIQGGGIPSHIRVGIRPTDMDPFTLKAEIGPPLPVDPAASYSAIEDCVESVWDLGAAAAGWDPTADCAEAVTLYMTDRVHDDIRTAGDSHEDRPISGLVTSAQALWASRGGTDACLAAYMPDVTQAYDFVNTGMALASAGHACSRPLATIGDIHTGDSEELEVTVVGSIDPNDKVGPAGGGTQHYVREIEPLGYQVRFENLAAATAPAQFVSVTDQIDVSAFDTNTLIFGPIMFGDTIVQPFPTTIPQTFDVDLRPEQNLIVRIAIDIDAGATVQWTMTALDPDTEQPPDDPLVGFLPPNVQPPEGEGSVSFTISPHSYSSSGVQFANQAVIVFDQNAPIATNTWLNILDSDLPASAVANLPDETPSVSFDVSWSGSDPTSGVRYYSIYVAEDGGDFYPWLQYTQETSAVFDGERDRTYAFYSIAFDEAGNGEATPSTPDATTYVIPLIGAITGYARADCPVPDSALPGLHIDFYEQSSAALLYSTVTDVNGTFVLDEVVAGDYIITSIPPIGYAAMEDNIPVTVLGGSVVNVELDFECVPASGDVRGLGYWKHEFAVADGGNGNADYSTEELCVLLGNVEEHFNNNSDNPVVVYEPPSSGECTDSVSSAYELLSSGGNAGMTVKAQKHLLALLLNVVAQRIHLSDIISDDSANLSQAITYCDHLIDGPQEHHELAKDIAEEITEGQTIDAGVIPLNTDNIAYRQSQEVLPVAYALAQNAPNPFNPVTTIRFNLPEPQTVSLTVYSLDGRLVTTLLNEAMPAGQHEAMWMGRDDSGRQVAAGTYLYRLQAGEFSETKRMMLLK